MKKFDLLKLSDEERAADERRELFDMADGLASRQPLLVRWTSEAISFAERLAAEGTAAREACALFCIRLFELLHGVSKWAREAAQTCEENKADFVPLCFELEALRVLLSDDELLWLEWRRDNETHAWLDRERKTDDAGVGFASRMLRADVTFVARREACERVTKRAGTDEAVAVALAKTSIDGLRRVLDIANALAL